MFPKLQAIFDRVGEVVEDKTIPKQQALLEVRKILDENKKALLDDVEVLIRQKKSQIEAIDSLNKAKQKVDDDEDLKGMRKNLRRMQSEKEVFEKTVESIERGYGRCPDIQKVMAEKESQEKAQQPQNKGKNKKGKKK